MYLLLVYLPSLVQLLYCSILPTLWFSYLTFGCYTTIMCLLSQILICWIGTFVYLYEFNTFTTYNVIYDNQFNSVIDKVNPMSLNSRIGAPSFDLFEYLCFLWKHAWERKWVPSLRSRHAVPGSVYPIDWWSICQRNYCGQDYGNDIP